jgi:hypothetical protein
MFIRGGAGAGAEAATGADFLSFNLATRAASAAFDLFLAAVTDPVDPFEVDPFEVDPFEVDPFEVDPFEVDPFEVDPFEL